MQIVQSRRLSTRVKVPIGASGFEVQFTDGRAIVPDDVAEVLVGVGGGFYRVQGPVLPTLKGARVLIVRDTGLGDLLLLTPLIRKLAMVAKAAVVDVLTHERYRCLFEGNPHMRRTYALEREGQEGGCDHGQYDVVLDLRLVVENAEAFGWHRHRADAFADCADIALTEEEQRLDYYLRDADFAQPQVRAVVAAKQARSPDPEEIEAEGTTVPSGDGFCPSGVIGYVWRASVSNRSWSESTHAAVITALVEAGYLVVEIDNEPQPAVAALISETYTLRPGCYGSILDLTGKTTLREIGAIFRHCDVVICPDTGLFHLAGALNVPTLTYFGAFPVEERQAHTNLTVLNDATAHCALAPCRSYRCLNRDGEGEAHCLTVAPGDVVAAVRGAIAKAAHSDHAEATEPDGEPDGENSESGSEHGTGVVGPEQDGGAAPTG